MKKVYFAAAIAAMAFAGCSTDDANVAPSTNSHPIHFTTSIAELSRSVPVDAFADEAEIGVFGTETLVGTPEVPTTGWMENMLLKNASGAWTYTGTKSFITGYKYTFGAYAPYDAAVADLSAIEYTASTTLADQKDLMYATPVNMDFSTTAPTAETAKVALTFNHALVQVKFSAKTAADYSAYYKVKVTGITVKNIASKATLNGLTGGWGTPSVPADYTQDVADVELKSSDYTKLDPASGEVLMLIPQTLADNVVEMTVEATNVTDNTVVKTTKIEVAFPNDTWEKNKVYRYKATLNLNAILGFENAAFAAPTINPWGEETEKEI